MPDQKNRHGCLTAFLIFIIVVNSLVALMYLLSCAVFYHPQPEIPEIPVWALAVKCFFSLLNLVFSIALLKLKKWGFWGFLFSSIISLLLNPFKEFGLNRSFEVAVVLFSIAVLYSVLHIGKDNKGWLQLD